MQDELLPAGPSVITRVCGFVLWDPTLDRRDLNFSAFIPVTGWWRPLSGSRSRPMGRGDPAMPSTPTVRIAEIAAALREARSKSCRISACRS